MVSSGLATAMLLLVPLHVAAFVGWTSPSRHMHNLPIVQRARAGRATFRSCSSTDVRPFRMKAEPFQLPAGDSMQIFKETVLESDLPVLVDFHAVWCAPCLMVAPVMSQMAEDFEGKIKVVKVDCDVHKDVMNHYRARGLPLLTIFNEGKLAARNEGTLDYEGTIKFLDKTVPGWK